VKYVALLGKHGKHIDSLEPLTVLVSRGGTYRNRACLRIARIQLQLQKNYDAAQATIQTMSRPWSDEIEAKRRQILKALKGKAHA
jgi:predicted negative regulator of RcsB-dependent stress response